MNLLDRLDDEDACERQTKGRPQPLYRRGRAKNVSPFHRRRKERLAPKDRREKRALQKIADLRCAMCRSLPSFEMLNPRNLRSSGYATALFCSLTFSRSFW